MKQLRHTIAVAFCFLFTLTPVHSAPPKVASIDSDVGAWTPISIQVPVHRKLSGLIEVQPRWQQLADHNLTETIVRTGLSYDLTKHYSVAGGYYVSWLYNPETHIERRFWEQFQSAHTFGKWKIQNRIRLEEIWKEPFLGPSWRLRNQIKVSYQLGKSPWYLVASEEPFVNLNSRQKGPLQGFNQNRLFCGVGRRIGETTRVECGYMNQFRNGQRGKNDFCNHLLIAQIYIDLRKLKMPRQFKLASKNKPPAI